MKHRANDQINTTLTALVLTFMLGACLLSSPISVADELKPFMTDGCSLFPDGTLKQHTLWLNCCTAHDLAYWRGGTYEDRQIADRALMQCVTNVGLPLLANLMLKGVRIGGTPYLPSNFRWGYGWDYPRTYAVLTQTEDLEVQRQMQDIKELTLSGKGDLNQ